MADFSKQYCELHDMGFEGDFDIDEIASTLKPGFYYSSICEGFGFTAISRDLDDKIRLYFPDWEDTGVQNIGHWIEYELFINSEKNRAI
jgi:hypothetical protein